MFRTAGMLLMLAAALQAGPKSEGAWGGNPVQSEARAAKKACRTNPLRCLRRLGAGEVNLAMRLSSWGIEERGGRRPLPAQASVRPGDAVRR